MRYACFGDQGELTELLGRQYGPRRAACLLDIVDGYERRDDGGHGGKNGEGVCFLRHDE